MRRRRLSSILSAEEERIGGYEMDGTLLRAYEMSSVVATATAVGDNTPPGRNRLPPRSPLNSTSHRHYFSCCNLTTAMTTMWRWRGGGTTPMDDGSRASSAILFETVARKTSETKDRPIRYYGIPITTRGCRLLTVGRLAINGLKHFIVFIIIIF